MTRSSSSNPAGAHRLAWRVEPPSAVRGNCTASVDVELVRHFEHGSEMPIKIVWRNIRGFVRAFRADVGSRPGRHRVHAIANTIKHGTTVCGGNANTGFGNVATERRENLMVEAAERYVASWGHRP